MAELTAQDIRTLLASLPAEEPMRRTHSGPSVAGLAFPAGASPPLVRPDLDFESLGQRRPPGGPSGPWAEFENPPGPGGPSQPWAEFPDFPAPGAEAEGGQATAAGRSPLDLRTEILGLLSDADREKARGQLSEALFRQPDPKREKQMRRLGTAHTLGRAFAAGGSVTGDPNYGRMLDIYDQSGQEIAKARTRPEERRRAKLGELSEILGRDLSYAKGMEGFQGNRVMIDGQEVPTDLVAKDVGAVLGRSINPPEADPMHQIEMALKQADLESKRALTGQRKASTSLSAAREKQLKDKVKATGLKGASAETFSKLVRRLLPGSQDGIQPTQEQLDQAIAQAQQVLRQHTPPQESDDPLARAIDAMRAGQYGLGGDPILDPAA